MKIKYIAAIFIYFTTFTLSVLIVGIPVSQSRSYKKPCLKRTLPVASTETELQVRIRKFLEADLQTGIELTNDKVRLSHSHNSLNAEKIATFNLVEKMEKVNCDKLPEDFCKAWDQHVVAWRYKTYVLDQNLKIGPFDHKVASEQISNSYQKMLVAARAYGVDFKY